MHRHTCSPPGRQSDGHGRGGRTRAPRRRTLGWTTVAPRRTCWQCSRSQQLSALGLLRMQKRSTTPSRIPPSRPEFSQIAMPSDRKHQPASNAQRWHWHTKIFGAEFSNGHVVHGAILTSSLQDGCALVTLGAPSAAYLRGGIWRQGKVRNGPGPRSWSKLPYRTATGARCSHGHQSLARRSRRRRPGSGAPRRGRGRKR